MPPPLVRYLLKSINILNMLLLAAVLAAGCLVLAPLASFDVKPDLPKAKQTQLPGNGKAPETKYPPLADYAVITEKNLFHPERITPVVKVPLPVPELVLYGTLITDGMSVAYVEDRKSPPGGRARGSKQLTLKKGQAISGFVLREIEVDRIVLYRGREQLVVKLDGLQKQRGGETAAPGAAPGGFTPGGGRSPDPSPTPGKSRGPVLFRK